jgi:hypothetical protein
MVGLAVVAGLVEVAGRVELAGEKSAGEEVGRTSVDG